MYRILSSNASWLQVHAGFSCVEVFLKSVYYVHQLTANSDSEQRLKLLAAMKQSDTADRQQLAHLEQDIREQDKLIAGYQTENERLFGEVKRLQTATKATEEKMFQENQKLKTDLANVR